MIKRDGWNPITDEMREYQECGYKHSDFPNMNQEVWITYDDGYDVYVLQAYIEVDYADGQYQFFWFNARTGDRFTPLYDEDVTAWKYIDIPSPYEEEL